MTSIGHHEREWQVLLIGGASGVGKTIAATQLGRDLSISCLQVDDIRLALQHSHVGLPVETDASALYFFLETVGVWRLPPSRLCDALIAVGEALSTALEIIIAHHVATRSPLIIEGDGILPSLLSRPLIHNYSQSRLVQAVFLAEADEVSIRSSIATRARGTAETTEEQLDIQAHVSWQYGRWLAQEAAHHRFAVIESRPWSTLADRILLQMH